MEAVLWWQKENGKKKKINPERKVNTEVEIINYTVTKMRYTF